MLYNIMKNKQRREDCSKMVNNGWAICNHCNKRFHNDNCTSRKNKTKDCLCLLNGISKTREYAVSYGSGNDFDRAEQDKLKQVK